MSTRLYEGMFLVDSNWASRSLEEVESTITAAIERHGGKIRHAERWDDRKLAYPIRIERTIHRRGTYYLTALDLPPEAITDLLAELEIDTRILRTLLQRKRESEYEWIFSEFPEVEDRRKRAGGGDDKPRRSDRREGEDRREADRGESDRRLTEEERASAGIEAEEDKPEPEADQGDAVEENT